MEMEIENIEIENIERNSTIMDTSTSTSDSTPTKKIRHIVISGGGTFLLNAYGALKKGFQQRVWDYENLQTIYGTSAGAIVGIILCLKMDWNLIDTYLIHRPWQNIFKIDILNIVNAYTNCGILNQSIFGELFGPLLRYIDLNVDSTMMDLYRHSGIELHMFTTMIGENVEESLKLIDISYKTHPDWRIIDACYASSCLPLLFKPYQLEGKTYIDGSIITSFPMKECCQQATDIDEILGVKKKSNPLDLNLKDVLLTEYLYKLIHIFIQKLTSHSEQISNDEYHIKNQLSIHANAISLQEIYDATNNMEKRKRLILNGEEEWCRYFGKIEEETEKEDILVEIELGGEEDVC